MKPAARRLSASPSFGCNTLFYVNFYVLFSRLHKLMSSFNTKSSVTCAELGNTFPPKNVSLHVNCSDLRSRLKTKSEHLEICRILFVIQRTFVILCINYLFFFLCRGTFSHQLNFKSDIDVICLWTKRLQIINWDKYETNAAADDCFHDQ